MKKTAKKAPANDRASKAAAAPKVEAPPPAKESGVQEKKTKGVVTAPRPCPDDFGQAIAARLNEREEPAEWKNGSLTFDRTTDKAEIVDDDGWGHSKFVWDGLSIRYNPKDAKQAVLSVAAKLIRSLGE